MNVTKRDTAIEQVPQLQEDRYLEDGTDKGGFELIGTLLESPFVTALQRQRIEQRMSKKNSHRSLARSRTTTRRFWYLEDGTGKEGAASLELIGTLLVSPFVTSLHGQRNVVTSEKQPLFTGKRYHNFRQIEIPRRWDGQGRNCFTGTNWHTPGFTNTTAKIRIEQGML